MVGQKKEATIWRHLDHSKSIRPIWDELKYKYENPMKEYLEMVEKSEDREAQTKKRKKKKKPAVQSNT